VPLGTPVGNLPEQEFVDPNGGSPGMRIDTFEQFERCRPEVSGLREIWFRYDDEMEYIARAARDPDALVRRNNGNVAGRALAVGRSLVSCWAIALLPTVAPTQS